jgi:DNA-binding CsgD family transcriptional regulator
LDGLGACPLSELAPDSALYLRVAQQAVEVDGPTALARWWRGVLQALLAHRALLVTPLHHAAPAGVPQWLGDAPWRGEAAACALAAPLALAWVSNGHRPCQVTPADLPRAEGLGEGCWVHGLRGRRLFAFFGVPVAVGGRAEETVRQSLALLVPLLDAALRGAGEGGPGVPSAGSPSRTSAGSGGMAGGWTPTAGEGAWQAPASPVISMRRYAAGALSERERQIMAWVAQGKTNPEIGCILQISEFTVKNHLKSIFSKLDVTNRAQAVARMSRLALHA